MARHGPNREIEIKLPLASEAQGRRLLRKLGLRVSRPRHHEHNLVFDFADGRLRARGILLRLRRVGRRATLTIKKPLPGTRHKTRLEIEGAVGRPAVLVELFEALGLKVVFQYEKYRTEFSTPFRSGATVTIDHTPIGDFLELEGPPDWIDETALRLGFTESDYITASYGELFRKRRRRFGLGREMLFPPGRGG